MIRLPSNLLKFVVLGAACLLLAPASALANNNNGGANNGGANNGGANNGGGGGAAGAAGVLIDAQGTLRILRADPRVTAQKLQAARQSMPQHLARPSKLRMVSLNRLEEAVSEKLANNEPISPEMIAVAGLTRLEYVFFYPESGDIVIAGPAEGFAEDAVGRIVGVNSGQPCLLLDDVIVALRAFGPSGDPTSVISVSIDPTQEGLARMRTALKNLTGHFRGRQDVPIVVNTLKQALGPNIVTIKGVPAGTHFAHVLTEADYRMKLIGIGLEGPPVRGLVNYVSQLTSASGSTNALARWFFVPDYTTLTASEDFTAMKLSGQGLKLVAENEMVTSDGTRKKSNRVNRASSVYTKSFTKHFTKVADSDPVYGQLRNLVDLTLASAFIQKQDFYGQCGWDLGVFADEDALPVETLPAPRQVETAITAVMKGRRLITPIGGGVAIQARKALKSENLGKDSGEIASQKDAISVKGLEANQWWWD